MNLLLSLIIMLSALLFATPSSAEKITIAAAADLKFAMDEIIATYNRSYPGNTIQVVYGSSGKFHTQIRQDAPYDLFFSADIAFPRELYKQALAGSEVRPYAIGRIVLWSSSMDASGMSLATLTDPKISKIAIANPKHAPYGKRAEEALRAAGVWEKVQSKLVYGENISQTAQYVMSGNAQIGIIALSLVLAPDLSKKGRYYLVPDTMHKPLEQGFIITRRAADNRLAKSFADYIATKQARMIMKKYGFILPVEQ